MGTIDFVLSWVDGNDPTWRSSRDKYMKQDGAANLGNDDTNGDCRYRDMGLLPYWFRAVEKFAPWVNKVFFVTCGQRPDWMNVNNPRLVLVDHEDFIPSKYLPTFNSSSIEMNFHRIPGLSEQFVLFNDDMFLLNPVAPEDFFRGGLPVLPANLNICRFYGNNYWSNLCLNDFCTVNEHCDIKQSIWDNRKKWFNPRALGVKLSFMNFIRYKINKTFSVNGYGHVAFPHMRETYQEVWEQCPEVMDISTSSRFRSRQQVNQWLMVAWNLATGRFSPTRQEDLGVSVVLSSQGLGKVTDIIKNRKVVQICINDSFELEDPLKCFEALADAFEQILPEKSSFEL